MYPGRRFALPWAISFCPFGAGTPQPHRVGTVPGFSPQSGTIVANPRLRRGAAGTSSRSVGSSSSNPSPYWLPLDTVEPRPHTRFCHRKSRTLRPGSIAARERSGSYECHDLRGARPSALGYSSDSFPNRCPPNEATAFPRASEALRCDSGPRITCQTLGLEGASDRSSRCDRPMLIRTRNSRRMGLSLVR